MMMSHLDFEITVISSTCLNTLIKFNYRKLWQNQFSD